jgi:hypothetical protein
VQWYNGILLLASFFSCRLLWGTYQSIRVYQDVWAGLHYNDNGSSHNATLKDAQTFSSQSTMRFFTGNQVPVWLAVVYLGSNVVLNTLNFYWFGKMIETVRSRFQEPRKGSRGEAKASTSEVGLEGMDGVDTGEQTSTDEADSDSIPKDEKSMDAVEGQAATDHVELAYAHQSTRAGNRIVVEKTEIRKRRLGVDT